MYLYFCEKLSFMRSIFFKIVEYLNILKLSQELSSFIENKDRCLLISENRPEWMISDLAIMLSKGITVPAYTTYVERDYEYLINDCNPSVVIVSDALQYNKIKKLNNLCKFGTMYELWKNPTLF